jgi:transposase
MPKQKRKKYTKEFKEEAIRLLEKDERSGDEIARALGIERAMLYRWRKELVGKPAPVSSVSQALSPDEKEELRRLRKEVGQLREDKEILKKWVAFCAKESK